MKKSSFGIKDTFVTGFAIFAMFLGAGNLIFPPHIGINAGNMFMTAMLGFLFTGIAMPMLGVVASAKTGGDMLDFSQIVSKKFGLIFTSLVLICIGPLLAIPRTGATTYEIGVVPIFGELNWGELWGISISRIVVSALYFLLNSILIMRPSSVVDIIGKYFTPVLLTLLIVLIVKGIVNPIGVPGEPTVANPFALGFREGYQTMDALGSFATAYVAIQSIKSRVKDESEMKKATYMSTIVAAIGLTIVYGGFVYLGATGSIRFKDIARTDATIKIVEAIGSNMGKILLAVSMSFACITTSVGLSTVFVDGFHTISGGKLSKKFLLVFVSVLSFILSVFGVNQIIKLAVPILSTLYPSGLVLIILNLFRGKIKRSVYRGGVYGALVMGVLYGIEAINPNLAIIQNFLYKLPLGSSGFAWIITALIGIAIGYFINKD
ncbi:MAG: branched-chain amino acid transport system II carrier protein [Ezakiella sp.]|nr:branched-chain amino acid transport system II carrier protein [Ezakiella sp.]